MKINFTDVPDAPSFEPVPKGTYVVTVAEGEVKESGENAKHPGTPYIKWDFVIAEGEYEGRHIWANHSTHRDALQYGLKPFLKALGYDPDGEIDVNIEEYLNQQLKVKVNIKKSDDYDPQNNVQAYYSLSDDSAPKAGTGSGSLLP